MGDDDIQLRRFGNDRGIRLARRSHWRYCVFSAALLCLFVPLGTLLGGLVIARLLDPKGRAAFTS